VLALLHSGRLVEAHEAADAVVTDARDRGAPMAYAEASLVRALVLLARGHVTDAAVDAQTALDRMGWHAHARTAAATLANCLIERRDLSEAASVLDRVEDIPPPVDVPGVDAYVYLARARLHWDCVTSRRRVMISWQPRRRYRSSVTPTRLRCPGDHLPASSPILAENRHVGMCLSKKRFASRGAMKCRSPWVSR